MALTYKGFHAYYVDDSTLEDVSFMGDVVLTFVNANPGTTPADRCSQAEASSWLNSRIAPTADLLTGTFQETPAPGWGYANALRMVIPATVGLPANNTGVRCRVKLIALDGRYAICSADVATGRSPNLRGSQWYLYSSEGAYLGSYDCDFLSDVQSCNVFYQNGYDGTLVDAPIYFCRLETQTYDAVNYTYTISTHGTTGGTARQVFIDWINPIGPLVPPDPYAPGGTSGPGGGADGTFDFTSTDIPIPPLPGIGAYNTGFLTLYKPTAGELNNTAQYMWSGSFDPDNLRKLFANPMDAILGLHIVPSAGAHPAAAASTLQIGNISTGLNMARVAEQYYELDCGTITISPKWGAYLDYSPYSKLSLYLPYIGVVPISPDDCMGGSIRVIYHVDILSGSCCVYVYCTSNRGADGHTLYTFTGACACDCPVTEGQYTNAVLGILGIAGGVAGAVSAGLSGNAGGITGGIGEAANAALSMVKPDIGRSGNFGGSAGLMGIQYPFLILTIPKMCTPGDQQIYRGYPSFVTMELSELSGYAEIEITHISNMPATAAEVDELRTILEGGAIF